MSRIVLDTDIGSDVDDALALVMLLGNPGLVIEGVTTVYGIPKLRAQIAKRMTAMAGHEIDCYAGAVQPLSGKSVWLSGKEGRAFPNLEEEVIKPDSAVEYLLKIVIDNPNQIDLIAIGPLTNIALALQSDARFGESLKHLWIMGGDFSGEKSEHNFKCDAVAADVLFKSKAQISVFDLPVTQQTILESEEIQAIRGCGQVGEVLFSEINTWLTHMNQNWTIPHDPLVVAALLKPSLFKYSDLGRVEIHLSGDDRDGKSTFTADPTGNVRVALQVEKDAFTELMLKSIKTAATER